MTSCQIYLRLHARCQELALVREQTLQHSEAVTRILHAQEKFSYNTAISSNHGLRCVRVGVRALTVELKRHVAVLVERASAR